MPKPTGYRLKHYIKAVELSIIEFGYGKVEHDYNGGSTYSFELFENIQDEVPCVVWGIHFGRDRKQEIYSDDLKKIWEKTMITKERFIEILQEVR